MSSIPQSLPTLSAGSHYPGTGRACVMEYVSLLAGEKWSDSPACTHPVLAAAARAVNDRLWDGDRHLLVPLIGRLFGTADTRDDERARKVLSVRLAVAAARYVADLTTDPRATAAIDAAEGWCDGRVSEEECRRAAAVATAAHAAVATAAAAYAADATAHAAHAAYAADATAHAAVATAAHAAVATAAAAYAADATAHAAVATAAHAAAVAGPSRLAGLLTHLLDEHTRLTGHTSHDLTDTDLARLAAAVA